MAHLHQTIAVVDKSGKVVSTSKHLFSVFKEARVAYRERKAEINAEKQAKIAEREARRALAGIALEDSRSAASVQRSGTIRPGPSHKDAASRRSTYYEQDLHGQVLIQRGRSAELARRHTSHDISLHQNHAPAHPGSKGYVDMDLAYGDFYQPGFQRNQGDSEQDLKGLVAKAKILLEEADCVQHTTMATMAHLQKNPEAMAAVALTLAEISTLVTKMAPGLLTSLRATAPTVFALLASPQFLIAAGVGIGVTIVMFGGYKIIKKITANDDEEKMVANDTNRDGGVDELLELQSEHLSRVEVWRRGVADAGGSVAGSSVDGEFITPTAAAMSRMDLTMSPRSRAPTAHRSRHSKARSKHADDVSKVSSRRSTRSHQSQSGSHSVSGGKEAKLPDKKKKPRTSRLKLMFTV